MIFATSFWGDGHDGLVFSTQPVDVPRRPVAQLDEVIGLKRTMDLLAAAAEFRQTIGPRVIWSFSSTSAGGGVAEMLQAIVGYVKDLAVDARWRVISGDDEFFRITKRLHNRLHGLPGGDGPLGEAEHSHFSTVLAENAASLGDEVSKGDVVLLHDPQTAGMVAPLVRKGAHVIWRCHIGVGQSNEQTGSAWAFLRPYLDSAHAYVFSRREYVPGFLPEGRSWVVPPSIDPFSPKNQCLDTEAVRGILTHAGFLSGAPGAECRECRSYVRRDGSPGQVDQSAWVSAESLPGPEEQLVVQVSRWDRLKDMIGVMRGFAAHVAPGGPEWLVLAGPAVQGVADDPEGAMVFAECLAEWRRLAPAHRARIMLASVAMEDVDDNAATINALQRHASVIVQKSIAEGFGLTVAEGMWKGRPVVGSDVGGIRDQIAEGTGILLRDPTDLTAFGRSVRLLLDDVDLANQMGRRAHEYVKANFVGDVHLMRYAHLITVLLNEKR